MRLFLGMNKAETVLFKTPLRIRLKEQALTRVPKELREDEYEVVKVNEFGFGIKLKNGSMMHIFPEECLPDNSI